MLKMIVALLGVLLAGILRLSAEEPAPLTAAKAAVEAARDDVHRQKVRLVWDEVVQPMPADLEVLVLRGYFNHDLLLLQWHDGQVTANIATVDRQWFGHAQANARSFATATLSAKDAAELWQTIQAIISLQATEVEEPNHHSESLRTETSSHESYHLLTWRPAQNGPWSALPVLCGRTFHNGIQTLDEVKMSAISSLVWARFPKARWTADPEQKTAEQWHTWWRTLLPDFYGDGVVAVTKRAELLVDDACEMLGDVGDASDTDLLNHIAADLRPSQRKNSDERVTETYWEDSMRDAIGRCNERIALREHWNSDAAARAIHASAEGTYSGEDQVRWLRAQFHQQDADGYHALLLKDVQSTDADLVVASITELRHFHPDQHRDELRQLLTHPEPEVVLTSALALIGKDVAGRKGYDQADFTAICQRAKDDPLLRDALAALDQLASDPRTPISANRDWFRANARTSAMKVLAACPLPWGWDKDRHRRQLDLPDETDGRVIAHLLGVLSLPMLTGYHPQKPALSAADRLVLLSVWRRCLTAPLTRGTLLAMEELMALNDRESLPQLNLLLERLRAGASPNPVPTATDQARQAWFSAYELPPVEKSLSVLSGNEPTP